MQRFEFLDALRGVAAICVVILHLAVVNFLPNILPTAFLAVDFFFVLSGFVIAHAYGASLATATMSFSDFARRRIIRLYPLAFLGSAIGFALLLAKFLFFPQAVGELWPVVTSGIFNLLMMPNFFSGEVLRHELFPVNGPLWTLFLELIVSLAAAVTLFGVTWARLLGVMMISGAVLTYGYLTHGPVNLGYDAQTFVFGLARVIFGFTAGIAIHRFTQSTGVISRSKGARSVLLLTVILVMSFSAQSKLLCIFATLFLFPFVVWAGSRVTMQARVFRVLGDLSYPVYILHFPILVAASGVFQVRPALPLPLVASIAVALILPAAWIALKFFDVPLRRRLTAKTTLAAPPRDEARKVKSNTVVA